jgi:hypothetical protein
VIDMRDNAEVTDVHNGSDASLGVVPSSIEGRSRADVHGNTC